MRENQSQFSLDQIKDCLRVELAQKIFLSELFRRFLASQTEIGYPEKIVNSYQDIHKLLFEVIDNIDIDSITHQDDK